jgi:hypothetical protein
MHCRIGWTRDILDHVGLTKKFITTTYKNRRRELLFERERALMPMTQPRVERERHIRALMKENAALEAQAMDLQIEASHRANRNPDEMWDTEDPIERIIKRVDYFQEPFYDRAILVQRVSFRPFGSVAYVIIGRVLNVTKSRVSKKMLRTRVNQKMSKRPGC